MGRRKGSGGVKEKRRKRVTVKLIPRMHAGEVTEPYRLMEEIQAKDHGDLDGVKIGLAWRLGWRPDANKNLCLGKCRKRGDLDRELDTFDFVIMLNKEAWPGLNLKEKRALIDHELCHANVVLDSDGEPKVDDADRLVCRIRKHDTEEFRDVVKRHGLWTSDLAAIAQAAVNDAQRPLLADAAKADDAKPDAKAWRKWKTEKLGQYGLPAGKVKLLEDAGLGTMGKLMDAMAKQGAEDFWWKDVKGFGEGGYDAMTEAIVKLRKKEPDFQLDQQGCTTTGITIDVEPGDEFQAKILLLSNQGMGMKKIAEECGVSERTVRKVLGKL
jgi:hypothetical protein